MRPPPGNAATGDNFFDRPREIDRIWKALASDSHLLIAAPRRIGKTSILLRLREMKQDSFVCCYVITQSIDAPVDFFKRLYQVLVEDVRVRDGISDAYKANTFFKAALDKLKGVKVAGTGIDFQDSGQVDYHNEFVRLVKSLPEDMPKIVLLVDEFPETLVNIEKKHGRAEAVKFLQICRELRQDPQVNARVLFVYTGSVGLENVVSRLGVPQHINDLQHIEIKQLTLPEARAFVTKLDKPFPIDVAMADVLIAKIGWRIPFHLVIVLQEMAQLWEDEQLSIVDDAFIDRALDSLMRQRKYFDSWQKRLDDMFDAASRDLAMALLSELSQAPDGILARDRIVQMAAERTVSEEQRQNVLRTLIHDGYINDNNEPNRYRFNSSLLQLWWRHNVAEF
jgi:hypothetical protein